MAKKTAQIRIPDPVMTFTLILSEPDYLLISKCLLIGMTNTKFKELRNPSKELYLKLPSIATIE